MLIIQRVYLATNVPIVGVELKPYLPLKRVACGTVVTDDVTKLKPIDGHFLKYKWYRIQSHKKVEVCSVHPTERARVQCEECVRAKVSVADSYHCSSKCHSDAWPHHRGLHDAARAAKSQSNTETDASYPETAAQRKGDETFIEVGQSRTYTPTAHDIGHVLKFECVVVDSETELAVGEATTLLTSPVIQAPSPNPRNLIYVKGTDLGLCGRISFAGTFTVLSYNILSDAQSTSRQYDYCPSWALSWTYRKHNLLREVAGYKADVVCLQEVQIDHFQEFFAPELGKRGYEALFKSKSSEVLHGNIETGCATFFRRDRFSHVEKYEVEFDKAKQSLVDALVQGDGPKRLMGGLFQDNVALIAVLEAKFTEERQLVCVTNTNVNPLHQLAYVKLWQVHALLLCIEKIAASGEMPVLLCGDFNSVPGSAIHSLITMRKVDPLHPEFAEDLFSILQPATKLTHQLSLVSAYTSYARSRAVPGQNLGRVLDPVTNEPLFTKCSIDFVGTHDYIFYSADLLIVESLLELLDKNDLRIPSPQYSSNHVALFAEFRCKPRPGC